MDRSSQRERGEQARVRIRLEGAPEREVPLGDGVLIGRGPENAVAIEHPSISRRHAEIRRDGARYRICDLGSLNGTLLNGQRLAEERELYHADEVGVGDATLVFLDPDSPDRSEATVEAWQRLQRELGAEIVDGTFEDIHAIVLTCEVGDAARLAQQLPGPELRSFLDGWWETARSLLVDAHCARLDGAPRDGLVVYWRVEHPGAPRSEIDAALRAALELAQLGAKHAASFEARFSKRGFELRAGLEIGPVGRAQLASGAGVALSGAPVLAAARLCDRAGPVPGSTLLSWAVVRWAAPGYRFHNLGEMALEGCSSVFVLALDPSCDAVREPPS